jgi:hypothetical protein
MGVKRSWKNMDHTTIKGMDWKVETQAKEEISKKKLDIRKHC